MKIKRARASHYAAESSSAEAVLPDDGSTHPPEDDDEPATLEEVAELRSQVRLLLQTVQRQQEDQAQLQQTIHNLQEQNRPWWQRLEAPPAWVLPYVPCTCSWIVMVAVFCVWKQETPGEFYGALGTLAYYVPIRVSFFHLWHTNYHQATRTAPADDMMVIPVDFALTTAIVVVPSWLGFWLIWLSSLSMSLPLFLMAMEQISAMQEQEQPNQSDTGDAPDWLENPGAARLSDNILVWHELYDFHLNSRLELFYGELWQKSDKIFFGLLVIRTLYRLYGWVVSPRTDEFMGSFMDSFMDSCMNTFDIFAITAIGTKLDKWLLQSKIKKWLRQRPKIRSRQDNKNKSNRVHEKTD